MGLSNNPGQYLDVDRVLAHALKQGGARYTLTTKAEAVRWRQRAYHYRKLLFKFDQERGKQFPGYMPKTPYDSLRISLEDNVCILRFDEMPSGMLTDLDGKPIDLQADIVQAQDDMLEEARKFAESLKGKEPEPTADGEFDEDLGL